MDRLKWNPKGSNVFIKMMKQTNQTLKGSNVYSNKNGGDDATPKGSYGVVACVFYKHIIPSGLISIQAGLEELKPFVQ